MHRRMQVAVQFEHVQLFVVFKLLGSVPRYLNHHPKHFGAAVADRQFQIIGHVCLFLLHEGDEMKSNECFSHLWTVAPWIVVGNASRYFILSHTTRFRENSPSTPTN